MHPVLAIHGGDISSTRNPRCETAFCFGHGTSVMPSHGISLRAMSWYCNTPIMHATLVYVNNARHHKETPQESLGNARAKPEPSGVDTKPDESHPLSLKSVIKILPRCSVESPLMEKNVPILSEASVFRFSNV